MSLKFKKHKQILSTSGNDEGLTENNFVKVKGKKRSDKRVKGSDFMKPLGVDMIKTLALGDFDDGESVSTKKSFRSGKSGKSSRSGKSSKSGKSIKSFRSMASDKSDVFSGRSSMKQSSRSAPPLKRFDVPDIPRRLGPSMDAESGSESESDEENIPNVGLDSDDDMMSVSTVSTSSSIHVLDKTLSRLKSKKVPPASSNNAFGMSDKEVDNQEKLDILARLHILKQRGTRLSKNYTTTSTLNELRMEMGRIEHEAETTRNVQRLRRWLLAGVSGMEYASASKYAPKFARNKLNGFSTYVVDGIQDYDPAFEQMGEKYSGVMGIGSTGNPLTDIFMLMVTQAFMFIFIEHKVGTKPPTLDEIKKEHPDLVRNAAREMAEKMRQEERQQEMQASAAREEARQQWVQQFHRPANEYHSVGNGFSNLINSPSQVTSHAAPQEYSNVYHPPPQQSVVAPPPPQAAQYKSEPEFSSAPPARGRKARGMPPPSMASAPSMLKYETINSEDTSLFNLKPPVKSESLETTFNRTAPIDDMPMVTDEVISSPFPEPEALPKVPFEQYKSVEIPTATRKGRQVESKFQNPPKSAMKKSDAKSITIG